MKDLFFYYDKNMVISDYSQKARDYLRDSFTIDFVGAEDSFYIGLYKPFDWVYMELLTEALTDSELVYEYSNGAGFSGLNVFDDTIGFQRSGFINWNKPSDWKAQAINGQELYWVKITSPVNFSIAIQGCNIVFADDNDLEQECRDIKDYLYKNDKSFIAYHVSTRNDIIQRLRNGGDKKLVNENTVNEKFENITKWDLLDIGEIRSAAKYLCLSKIFFDVSENVDDKAFSKYKEYMAQFGDAFELFFLSIDKNDDGQVDIVKENLAENDIEVYKL